MKASRCYTGSRSSVGTPTLNRNQFMQQVKRIRKARQEHPAAEKVETPVVISPEPETKIQAVSVAVKEKAVEKAEEPPEAFEFGQLSFF